MAAGILLYGSRAVSIDEFARLTGILKTAAREVADRAASTFGLPRGGSEIPPGRLAVQRR